jgi:hypothetical protein
VKDLIRDLLLEKPVMEMGINIVDVVKYISFMMVSSVLVVVWHYGCHLAEELACSILQYYLQLMTKYSTEVRILSGNVDETCTRCSGFISSL